MNIIIANTWFERLKGLMFKKDFDDVLVIAMPFESKLNGIHTFFMKFPIDVYFLDKRGKLVSYKKNVQPWTSGVYPSSPATYIIEVKAGKKIDTNSIFRYVVKKLRTEKI